MNIGDKMKSRKGKAFRLPMTAAFVSYRRTDGKTVAHSLDFDLVAVAESEVQAFNRLRIAVKTYIEYGLSNNWTEDIFFPAPTECWEKFGATASIQTMPPIEIEDDRMIVVRAVVDNHEHREAPCAA